MYIDLYMNLYFLLIDNIFLQWLIPRVYKKYVPEIHIIYYWSMTRLC